MNSLIGSKDIESDYENLIVSYPEVLHCIPLLLAVRQKEIYVFDTDGEFTFSFEKANYHPEQYKMFMRKTGLFDLLEKHIINNLFDYATGIETGLDSNARKNRGGHLMEALIESYLKKSTREYYKEMAASMISRTWGLDLSALSNRGKTEKVFDFVVKTPKNIYAIETNFYSGGGSKLNETARSYKALAQEAASIPGFTFVWFTDGEGWLSARNNLEETFESMTHLYNIADLEKGIAHSVFI